ncbi:DUF4398 domain-containing protein [Luteimonas lutimaris]|uniref:DUF4398 domain-containing protein n=1 Tax=Luteimonas lutimaris TaxID=698645 RepID=A0ABP7MWR1_9GAMM
MSEPPLPGEESLRFRRMLMTMAADPRERDPPMATSFAQFRSALQVPVFAIVLALTACASLPPPTTELAAARQAVSQAGDADADQYAADEISQARRALEMAQAAMARGREDEARSLAVQAAAVADLARARSNQAVTETELAQRRAEISRLRQKLGVEDGQ